MGKGKYYFGVALVALVISTAGIAALVRASDLEQPEVKQVVEKKAGCGCQNKATTCTKCAGCQAGGDGSCGCQQK